MLKRFLFSLHDLLNSKILILNDAYPLLYRNSYLSFRRRIRVVARCQGHGFYDSTFRRKASSNSRIFFHSLFYEEKASTNEDEEATYIQDID